MENYESSSSTVFGKLGITCAITRTKWLLHFEMSASAWISMGLRTTKWSFKGKSAAFQAISSLDENHFIFVYSYSIDSMERNMIVILIRFNDNFEKSLLAKSLLAKFFVQDFSSDLVNVFEKSLLAKSLLAKDSLYCQIWSQWMCLSLKMCFI